MRFEEVAYTADGVPVTVGLHARLTVMSLPAGDERAAWIARLLGALEGVRPGDGVSLVFVDHAGRRVRLARDDQGGAILTDLATGTEMPYSAAHLSLDGRLDWFASIGITSRTAYHRMVVEAEAFSGSEEYDRPALQAQLKKARQRLARVERQRQAAVARSRDRDDLRRRIAELDQRILGEAAARTGRSEADATVALVAAARAADAWQRVLSNLEDAAKAFGPGARLDPDALTRALARPAEVPPDLESLAAACRAAAERRDELVARLDPQPDDDTLRELVDEVEPAYADALVAFAEACRPFGVGLDAARIEAAGIGAAGIEAVSRELLSEVAARAAEAGDARRQQALEDAEAECREAQERLLRHLAGVGLPADTADDLAAGAEVVAERSRLSRELQRSERGLPDEAEVAQRHSALERSVASLEASLSAGQPLLTAEGAETVLLGRAAAARRIGRHKEPLPLFLNDALGRFRPGDKRALLDVVARLGETTQIVYLTDDVETLAWASARAAKGEIAVWRPEGFATVA